MGVKIHLDFETRCTINLVKVGVHKYTNHDTFDVMCVAFEIEEEDGSRHLHSAYGRVFEPDSLESMDESDNNWAMLRRYANEGATFIAHNASFEIAVWNNHLTRHYNMPKLENNRWVCTASIAASMSLPRALGDVAETLGLSVQKDKEGRFNMLKMCKPDKDGNWVEDDESVEKLISYCVVDVKTESALYDKLGDLIPQEQKLWELDMQINQRGIHVDIPMINEAIMVKERIKRNIQASCNALTGFNPSQVQKLMDYADEMKYEMKDLRAQTLKKALLDPDCPAKLKKVLQWRQDFATTSLAKLDAAVKYEEHSIIRNQFMYHGATTGRWSGKGVQFHNLPRGSFNEDIIDAEMEVACNLITKGQADLLDDFFPGMRPMEVMKSSLRGMVTARKGCQLRVIDYSQIEARVLPWMAGQTDLLNAFRQGKDLYKFTASIIYGVPYDQITKQQRFVGKTASLALQYQGGAGAFQSMAMNMGVLVETDLAEDTKTKWRTKNHKIVKFWYDLEKAAIQCVVTGVGKRVNGVISFRHEGDFLTMELPSGRKLYYYKPEVKMVSRTMNGNTWEKQTLTHLGSDQQRGIRWGRISTYGGKLSENATQAVSRDLLADAMFKLEDKGYNIVLHVHDELVDESKLGIGSLDEMRSIMLDTPDWATNLPVDADGFEGQRYRK